jgi:hypothetical protein
LYSIEKPWSSAVSSTGLDVHEIAVGSEHGIRHDKAGSLISVNEGVIGLTAANNSPDECARLARAFPHEFPGCGKRSPDRLWAH